MFLSVVCILCSCSEQMDTVAGIRHSQGNVVQSQLDSLIIQEMLWLLKSVRPPLAAVVSFWELPVASCWLFSEIGIAEKKHLSTHCHNKCTKLAKHCL